MRLPLIYSFALLGCAGTPVGQIEQGYTLKCPNGMTVPGVDISHFDGAIDWGMVQAGGKLFAQMKATEGTGYIDPTFATNWAGALAAGVLRGPYVFWLWRVDPVAQVNFLMDQVDQAGGFQAGDLPIELDVEDTAAIPPNAVALLQAGVDQVRARTGRDPIIYTYLNYWQNQMGNPDFSSLPLWIADYSGATCPRMPTSFNQWAFWQYTMGETVSGIPVPADVNFFNGSLAELQAFANSPSTLDGGSTTGGTDGSSSMADGSFGGADAAKHDASPPVSDRDATTGNAGNPPPQVGGCSLTGAGATPGLPLVLFLIALAVVNRQRAR